jgi:ATPase family associated with various cellular activities (AAA)
MSPTRGLRIEDMPAAPGGGPSGPRDDSTALDPALARVQSRVRLRARLRVEWLRTLWRHEASAASSAQVVHAEVDLHLDDRDHPAAEALWRAASAGSADSRALATLEAAIAADTTTRLDRLARLFGLSVAERDLLATCLAATLDPALLRVYAYLQDHAGRPWVTDSLVARLFGHGLTLGLDADAAVHRWAMVSAVEPGHGEPAVFALDPALRDWLLGSDAIDPEIAATARQVPEQPPLADWPVADTVAQLHRWLAGPSPTPVRVRVAGPAGSGRRTFAAAVAARLGLPVLAIDTTAALDAGEPGWTRLYIKAQRHAFLSSTALALSGDPVFMRSPPAAITSFPLQFLIAESSRGARPAPAVAIDHLVELAPPSLEARRALWQRHAPWSASWPVATRDTLIAQHRVLPGELARVARRGPSGPAEAEAVLRESSREALAELAQHVECPFTRDDLVVTPPLQDALDDLVFEAHERVAFWERPEARRLFPQGRGLLALLCGPPGTGKTMSAQVIAAALGVDLFRIDLAAVVSKWVGETSRNIDRLLARAARLDVVLLFDEADALFGRRTEIRDANDRFANTDTGYLLQAIESYRGVALLASNRKVDIDPAFLRRLRYVLDYPLPEEAERRRMWRRMVEVLVGSTRAIELHGELDRIAAAVEATGGQIKYAVLTAVFAARREARPLDAHHLLRGLERELAKEGRPLGERVRERLGVRAR